MTYDELDARYYELEELRVGKHHEILVIKKQITAIEADYESVQKEYEELLTERERIQEKYDYFDAKYHVDRTANGSGAFRYSDLHFPLESITKIERSGFDTKASKYGTEETIREKIRELNESVEWYEKHYLEVKQGVLNSHINALRTELARSLNEQETAICPVCGISHSGTDSVGSLDLLVPEYTVEDIEETNSRINSLMYERDSYTRMLEYANKKKSSAERESRNTLVRAGRVLLQMGFGYGELIELLDEKTVNDPDLRLSLYLDKVQRIATKVLKDVDELVDFENKLEIIEFRIPELGQRMKYVENRVKEIEDELRKLDDESRKLDEEYWKISDELSVYDQEKYGK